MTVDDRRAHIVAATIPLILEGGPEVTTREIAQAAGIAEGTIFRVFTDKNHLIDAAIESVMDPEETIRILADLEPGPSLHATVTLAVTLLRGRVESVMRFMTALGPRDRARHHGAAHHRTGDAPRPPLGEATAPLAALFEAHREQLRVDPTTAVDYLRILVFGTSMRFLGPGREIATEELVDFILRGLERD